ncbi:MAG TPA: FAD:protein FMN transferase [Candidatus Paceibacterota bacterium]|nr:FAD:protein FMN transferase [Candidatus Paceibacterota bacterium]
MNRNRLKTPLPASLLHLHCLLAALVLVLPTVGCKTPSSQPPPPPSPALHRYEFSRPHMGTLFRAILFATNAATAQTAADAAFRRIAALEEIMSDYQADSELNRLRDAPHGIPIVVSYDLFRVMEQAQWLARKSDGAFDVTAGAFVRLWRFSRKRHTLPTPDEMQTARQASGYNLLRLDPRSHTITKLVPGMRFDLGGIAKGYAADEALAMLRLHGVHRALVAASGDLALGDPPPGQPGWTVGISEIGSRSNHIVKTLRLSNAGISTSGDAEQALEIHGVRYSHILNPKTGLGLTNRIQATVIAPTATLSDALATTVCILGPQKGLRLVNSIPRTHAAIFWMQSNHICRVWSPRFPKE